MSVWTVLLLLAVLLLLKGFFSGSEIALVSADKIRMRHKARMGHRGAKLFLKMFKNPERLLTTTLVGTNLATVSFTTLATLSLHELFGEQGDLYAFVICTPLLLILGEIVPKSIYQQKAEAVSPVIVYPLKAASVLFLPIIILFSQLARAATRLAGAGKASQSVFLTREQLRAVLEMTERRSSIAAFRRGRIRKAVRFGKTQAAEVMTPLRDLDLFEVDGDMAELQRMVKRAGYRSVPVYRDNTANIIGVIALTPWDLMRADLSSLSIVDLMLPAQFVAPQQQLAQLLPVLRERQDQSVIVVDEYGSAIGMLTLEEVLEQVLGEINIGYHFQRSGFQRQRTIQTIEDGIYLLSARLSISDVDDIIGLNLPADAYRTIGGMLLAHLRHIPEPGEQVVDSGYRFTVEDATERTVTLVRAEPDV